MQLPQLVVAAGTVHDDLHAVQAIIHMRVLGYPELLAGLASNRGVIALNHGITKLCCLLAQDSGDLWPKLKVFNSATIVSNPGREPSTLSVVIPSSQKKFGSDKQNLLIKTYDTAIVEGVLVVDGHANVTNDIFGEIGLAQDV